MPVTLVAVTEGCSRGHPHVLTGVGGRASSIFKAGIGRLSPLHPRKRCCFCLPFSLTQQESFSALKHYGDQD